MAVSDGASWLRPQLEVVAIGSMDVTLGTGVVDPGRSSTAVVAADWSYLVAG